MLPGPLKEKIQAHYREMLAARDLVPRYGQRQMIAEIANTLAPLCEEDGEPNPVAVIEAGTGTGKTLAYLLSCLPLALEYGYKVVVATATVSLQEQVVSKDIPELQAASSLHFKFALAKGRGRYLCLAKLDSLLSGSDSLQAMQDLYGQEFELPGSVQLNLYRDMLTALGEGGWEGDRDNWRTPLSEKEWRPLTVDRGQCSGPRCSFFSRCSFYKARENLDKADCIVANHDLVLTDMALGGGVILPDPEKCIYVFDEGHHLPQKSNSHFARQSQVRSTMGWLQRLLNTLGRAVEEGFLSQQEGVRISSLAESLLAEMEDVFALLEGLLESLADSVGYEQKIKLTFDPGEVPESLQEPTSNLAARFQQLAQALDSFLDQLKTDMQDDPGSETAEKAEQWFPLVGAMTTRALANAELWSSFVVTEAEADSPVARWLIQDVSAEFRDIQVYTCPVLAAENLQHSLWERCAGAVLTSATLSALGSFDMIAMRAGLPGNCRFLSIPSPFDFSGAASLVVPRMGCEPSNYEQHTAALIAGLQQVIDPGGASLVLFSSRRQMRDVMQEMPEDWQELILCQDDYQKAELIKYHKKRVDDGEGSMIFGLASFAEGIDLPGHYCVQVAIAKIPFAVPDDPVESTLAKWVESAGKNPFNTLSVPDAALKLVQAAGRLLRSEKDRGEIFIFDERLVTRAYGKSILGSLPPYTRELLERDIHVG